MIRTIDIHKSFNDQEVLKGVTTEFFPGKTNLIIGRSGAGKTVLLKILVGLVTPTTGDTE
jgi:phospholipid/cholesterol/gamma-HCH transport system ATP-binding protein